MVDLHVSVLTEEVLRSIKEALQGLACLNAAAIQEGKHALGHARETDLERFAALTADMPAILQLEPAATLLQSSCLLICSP